MQGKWHREAGFSYVAFWLVLCAVWASCSLCPVYNAFLGEMVTSSYLENPGSVSVPGWASLSHGSELENIGVRKLPPRPLWGKKCVSLPLPMLLCSPHAVRLSKSTEFRHMKSWVSREEIWEGIDGKWVYTARQQAGIRGEKLDSSWEMPSGRNDQATLNNSDAQDTIFKLLAVWCVPASVSLKLRESLPHIVLN